MVVVVEEEKEKLGLWKILKNTTESIVVSANPLEYDMTRMYSL